MSRPFLRVSLLISVIPPDQLALASSAAHLVPEHIRLTGSGVAGVFGVIFGYLASRKSCTSDATNARHVLRCGSIMSHPEFETLTARDLPTDI